jgi:hypothetical protein
MDKPYEITRPEMSGAKGVQASVARFSLARV